MDRAPHASSRPFARRAIARGVLLFVAAAWPAFGCGSRPDQAPASAPAAGPAPSVLLVTLDTTRADAIGPEASGVTTPAFNALAQRGLRFRQAYTTVPETLPAHVSLMTGLYPAGHGVHQNARYLPEAFDVLAEQLQQAGYQTRAVVSSFVLGRQFGLARGFQAYDDAMPAGRDDRTALEATEAALALIALASPSQPLFLWVHYWDPHAPYTPPEPFRSRYPTAPYLGEVAAMDEQMGRLIDAFDRRVSTPRGIIVVSDHGEGLGEHGELQHGNLLYQSTMHVPLVVVGPGVAAGVSDAAVSTRRVYHTILDWAGLGAADSLRAGAPAAGSPAGATDIVLGEAMKPFLEYGWQPQIMAVSGRHKVIAAGRMEAYDLVADPGETRELQGAAPLGPGVRAALDDYPTPSPDAARAPAALGEEARRKLASLGYVSATAAPVVRKDAPRPADMVHLFDVLESASRLFVEGRYAQVIPLLDRILVQDPHNLDATLRLATAYSMLGRDRQAVQTFQRAATLAPRSDDVRTYLALHYERGASWPQAAPLLEEVAARSPDRLPVLEALARVRERQGRLGDAVTLRQQIYRKRTASAADWLHLGGLAMAAGDTPAAIDAFERARQGQGAAFTHNLELGVLYIDARRYPEARVALDLVPTSHRDYAMAAFKRAQVSVLLNEPDRAERIARARRFADDTTRDLIARERLFEERHQP